MTSPQIIEAFRTDGFAEITLPPDIVNSWLRLADTFYAMPLRQRLLAAAFSTHGVLGYYPSESEAKEATAYLGDNVPIFESVRARGYCSFDYIADDSILQAADLFGTNRWPNDSEFQNAGCLVYEGVARFMKSVGSDIVASLRAKGRFTGLPIDVFERDCCSMMRLLKYARCDGERLSKAHTDYEFITLIQASAQGLEVQNTEGDWHLAPCSAGKALLLPGDMIEVASQGWVRSVMHRVRFGLDDRLAAIFFQGIGLDTEIAYSVGGVRIGSTFGKHLCGMLVRGAAHLQNEIPTWEQKLGIRIPEKNPFRRAKG